MIDPFYAVQLGVEKELKRLQVHHDKFKVSKSENDAQMIEGIIDGIEDDLESLKETLLIVSQNRSRFVFNDIELAERKNFIREIRDEIQTIQKEINQYRLLDSSYKFSDSTNIPRVSSHLYDPEDFSQSQIEIKNLEQEQDKYLDEIEVSLDSIRNIGEDMGEEIQRQNPLIDRLLNQVEKTSNNIKDTIKRIDTHIENTNNSSTCVTVGALSLTSSVLLAALFLL